MRGIASTDVPKLLRQNPRVCMARISVVGDECTSSHDSIALPVLLDEVLIKL